MSIATGFGYLRSTVFTTLVYLILIASNSQAQQGAEEYRVSVDSGSWKLLTIPGRSGDFTVESFFSGVLDAETYESEWIVFTYNASEAVYENPGLEGTLKAGTGFWFIQIAEDNIAFSLPDLIEADVSPDYSGCGSDAGCYVLDLETDVVSEVWNLAGLVSKSARYFEEIGFQVDEEGSACQDYCTSVEANAQGVVVRGPYIYDDDASTYILIDEGDSISPVEGFWLQMGVSPAATQLVVGATPSTLLAREVVTYATPMRISVVDRNSPYAGLYLEAEGDEVDFSTSRIIRTDISTQEGLESAEPLAPLFEVRSVNLDTSVSERETIRVSVLFDENLVPDSDGDGVPDLYNLVLYKLNSIASIGTQASPDSAWTPIGLIMELVRGVNGSVSRAIFETTEQSSLNGEYFVGYRTDGLVDSISYNEPVASSLAKVFERSLAGISCTTLATNIKVSESGATVFIFWRAIRGTDFRCTSSNHTQTLLIAGFARGSEGIWGVTAAGFAAWVFDAIDEIALIGGLPRGWDQHVWNISLKSTPFSNTLGYVNTGLELYLNKGIDDDLAHNNAVHEVFHVYQLMVLAVASGTNIYDSNALQTIFSKNNLTWAIEGLATWFADELAEVSFADPRLSVYGLNARILDAGLWAEGYVGAGYDKAAFWKLVNNFCGLNNGATIFFKADRSALTTIIASLNSPKSGTETLEGILSTRGCSLAELFHEYNARTQVEGNLSFIENDEFLQMDGLPGIAFSGLAADAQSIVDVASNETTLGKSYASGPIVLRPGGAVSVLLPPINTRRTCRHTFGSLTLSVDSDSTVKFIGDLNNGTSGFITAEDFSTSLFQLNVGTGGFFTLANLNSADGVVGDINVSLEITANVVSRGLVIIDSNGNCRFP